MNRLAMIGSYNLLLEFPAKMFLPIFTYITDIVRLITCKTNWQWNGGWNSHTKVPVGEHCRWNRAYNLPTIAYLELKALPTGQSPTHSLDNDETAARLNGMRRNNKPRPKKLQDPSDQSNILLQILAEKQLREIDLCPHFVLKVI